MLKNLKKIAIWMLSIIILLLIGMWGVNKMVVKAAEDKLYTSSEKIPHNKVGLLLGTGKYLISGYINQYYQFRIEAAVALYKAGKIDFILVSGDNSKKEYDEPTTIKNDLIAQGVPEEKIYLDYAGFRTLDSVVRCREIFGQESITVISQQFHNERAVYLAKKKGIKAIGFNAKDVDAYYGFRTRLREKFARVKMMLDLVFGKEPKFLGEKIEIK
jgi:SanA protein